MKHSQGNMWSCSTVRAPLDIFDDLFRVCTTRDPKYTCVTDEGGIVVSIDVPGVSPNDIKLTVTDDVVNLVWERAGHKSKFAFKVEATYDAQGARAALKHGVLDVSIPKSKDSRSKTITIDVA